MPTVESVARTNAGLAAELRVAVMRLKRRLVAERDPANPLSVGQMVVLGVLYREGETTVGGLAAHERVRPPSMTRTVAALADGGYVTRRPHETDGRLVLVDLTELGRSTLLADRAKRDEWLAQRLRRLDPAERDTLRAALPILTRLTQED